MWKRKGEGLLPYREAAQQGHPAAADDPQAKKIRELEAKIAGLEGELGRRSLEASFFKSALRRVEGLRRQSDAPGGTASTTMNRGRICPLQMGGGSSRSEASASSGSWPSLACCSCRFSGRHLRSDSWNRHATVFSWEP